ncbi:MAG: LacI family DNA-binding transcriptional regulator [Eubacterium sp.]|nr:LacI family DNA-binding transcriptional regulator [Eubacterium sp.]
MVTIKEIAEICGVSATTVSNVLNGKAKTSEETRQKILKAVEEYGYTPNAIAQGLRNRRSKVIAVISEDIAQFTSPAIIESIVEICEKWDYRVVVYNLRLYDRWQDTWYGDEEKYRSIINPIIRDIRSSQIDGVIYVAGHARVIKTFNRDFELPIVMCYAFSDSKDIPSVVIDDESSAYEVVSYLIGKGHKRIGFVGGRADNIHTVKRLSGYQRALYDNKIFYDPDLIYYGDWSRESGYAGAKRLFDKNVSAFFGISDRMTGGIYDFLYEKDMLVGNDISVVGFDNENISSFFRPPLTTTELPLRAIGKKSAELILDRIENPGKRTRQEEPEIFDIPCKMIIRDSVKEIYIDK